MRYWWVNQNQTYKQEQSGGYLWSPKRNANGARNPLYEAMREVAPGDIVFSFVDTRIGAIGIAESYCYESPKPEESGAAGLNWGKIGWRVRADFKSLANRVRPKDHMDLLRPLLPDRYGPLQANGNGIQSIYLTELSQALAEALISLIGPEAIAAQRNAQGTALSLAASNADLESWERRIETEVNGNTSLPETEREAIIMARRGQGLFRKNVMQIEQKCRITGVSDPAHLRASHCKPWRHCDNEERLDGENGLLLTPSIDHLFDGGFISFEGNGNLIVSPIADRPSLDRMGVPIDETANVGGFSSGQCRYLDYHRDAVLKRAVR